MGHRSKQEPGTSDSGELGRVGPYRLDGRLGTGGMGEVYRAFDQRLERWVALKRLRADREIEDRHRQRFRVEAKAAAALSHSGIVQIHDVFDGGRGRTWIVMELVDGRALSEIPTPFPVAECLELGAQVADALSVAHVQGIVHRDLKAENVLVTGSGQAKIADFGLAKRPRADPLSVTGQVLGTVRAMSPEQSRGLEVDGRSDLFALGVLLYELLTGVSPFQSSDPLTTLERIRTHAHRPASALHPAVPPSVSAYLDRLLEKNPNRRPADARQVAADLRRLTTSLALGSTFPTNESTLDHEFGVDVLGADAPRDSVVGSEPGAGLGTDDLPSSLSSFSPFGSGASRGRLAGWLISVLILVTVAVLSVYFWNPRFGNLGSSEGWGSGATAVDSSAAESGENTTAIYVAVGEPRLHGVVGGEHVVGGENGAVVEHGVAEFGVVSGQDAVSGQPQHVELLQAAVRTALFKGLLSLEGVLPVTAERLDTSFETDLGLAQALSVKEVISPRLDCRPAACSLVLQRIQAADGQVLGVEEMQLPEGNLFLVSTAVRARVQRLYDEFELRPGAVEPAIENEAYSRLLELRRAFKQGSRPLVQIAEELVELAQQTPSYPEVHLLTADVAHSIYFHSRQAEDLSRAFAALKTARNLLPWDPEPLYRQVSLSLDVGRLPEARAALDDLEALQMGDIRVGMRRALLWEKEGRAEEALQLLRRQLEIFPAWQGLLDLAEMEYRQGQTKAARATLERLLERTPDSGRARSFLAQLELLGGDPLRAESLYRQMSNPSSSVAPAANLGLALMLQGRFDEAAEQFRQTVQAAPENPALILNLADAELLMGRDREALELYDRVIELTDDAEQSTDNSRWQLLTVRAQAFAHSDRPRRAAETIHQALLDAPSHPQVAYEASLVFALIGESSSALAHAKRARRVFGPAWFRLTWFENLLGEPEFEALLRQGS